MTEADLAGANLARANLEGVDLREAIYNHETRWPRGFDLSRHEMEMWIEESGRRPQP